MPLRRTSLFSLRLRSLPSVTHLGVARGDTSGPRGPCEGPGSQYWGQTITVTGLLTGQDLLNSLQGQPLGDGVVIPSLMLKQGDTLFLDDMSVAEVAETLQTPIISVNGVEGLIATLMG